MGDDGEQTNFELDRESEALGSYFRQHWVLPDDRMGIFKETCSDYIVLCTGALKAGDTFMPLAPDSPDNLLNKILEGSKPKVIITKERYLSRFSSCTDGLVLPIVDDRIRIGQVESESPSITPHNLT